MDIGRRCFHFALFGLTRTIMTERYAFARYETLKHFSYGSSLLTSITRTAVRSDACRAGRAQSAPEDGWRLRGAGICGARYPCRMRSGCNRASAECSCGAFRPPMEAVETSDKS